MSIQTIETTLGSTCPVCGAHIALGPNTEESEILICTDCQSMLVVDSLNGTSAILSEAPSIEEDWGQ